jgi:Flp pilus assembly protein TadG
MLRSLQPNTRATEPTPNGRPRSSARSGRRGYILVATTISLVFLLGVAGLAVDVGRMYITKNEAQAYVDSASLSAAMQLDGTSDGITRAANAPSSDTGKWRFDTTTFANVVTTFGITSTGPFTATPPNPPTNYNYVQVVATVNLPMYLIRPLTGPTATVAAAAVASRVGITTLPSGIFPFSPYTRKASPDNALDPFGYKIGKDYTIRWGAPGNNTNCGTDSTKPNLSENGKIRGYCCVSQSAASLRESIVGALTDSITIGQNVPMDNGAKQTELTAIALRVEIDSDTSSATYADYVENGRGNGARVVVMPVNGGDPNYIALGFAGFFLLNDSYYLGLTGGNDSACAEYIGAWTQGVTGQNQNPSGSGAYHIRLVQ